MQIKIDPKTQAVIVKPTATEVTALNKALDVLFTLSRVDGSALKEASADATEGVSRVLGLIRGEVEQPTE